MRIMRVMLAVYALTIAAGSARAQPARNHLDAKRHLRLGQQQLRAGQWDQAEAEFQAAIQVEPSLELAHYSLGQVYMATKRYPAAVSAYTACREAFVQSNARRALGDLSAQRQLDDFIQMLEDQKTALGTGRGNVLSGGQFEIDRRIADLRILQSHSKATSAIPAWISLALGSAEFRSGALADAEREYIEALKADPKLGEAHNNLAVVYMLTGRYDEARAEITAAEKSGFRINPQLATDLKHALERR
jgi:tetratricopeptide (TPR) repeat protein